MRHLPTLAALAFIGLTLTSCGVAPADPSPSSTPTPTPTPTPVSITVKTSSGNVALKVRHVPAVTGTELAKIASGSSIIVDCKLKGATVSGTQGSTDVWDHVNYQGKSGYVSAAYVEGGAADTIPTCAMTPTQAATPLPLPSAGADATANVVAIARSQVGVAEKPTNCSPYSKKCEEWCAHFATWVWQKAGVTVPDYAFTGDIYTWGKKNNKSHDGVAGVGPGDMVLYGTGPTTTKTSTHVDIVVAVFPDHLRVVGGNVDDRVSERDVPLTGIYAWVGAK